MSSLASDLRAAMSTQTPWFTFRNQIKARLDAGARREQLLFELEDLQQSVPENQLEVIFDVLDCLYGWTRPEYRL